MEIIESTNGRAMRRLLERSGDDLAAAAKVARRIVDDVRKNGDRALLSWTRKLDKRELCPPGRKSKAGEQTLVVTPAEMEEAYRRIPSSLRVALRTARRHVETMARWQKPVSWTRQVTAGVEIGQQVRALDSVGCYVPGGRHPLPSTVIMTAVPARVAGVERVVVCCPQPVDEVLAAAHLAGVDAIYRVGGAQAVAALAYGTESIPRVDKIVGPGNIFVTAAKREVWADCAIDFLAGPTEVLLLAEAGANPDFLAADLIAQAEHDPQATAWLVTPSRRLGERVLSAVRRQLLSQPNETATLALEKRGAIILTPGLDEAVAIANRIAPEHITVPAKLVAKIRNAGSIFVGEYAPQAVGDYMSGTNHVLPTAATARLRGGLSVADFTKVITVQKLSAAGLRKLAPHIVALARAEGLEGHANSVAVRVEDERKPRRGSRSRRPGREAAR